jgi:hypothetical protein
MVDILTPSTGETRPGGKLRLNNRGFEVGERVLAWAGGGWIVSDITALADTTVGVRCHGALSYRDIAGTLSPKVDAEQLLARIRAVERDADAAIEAARQAKWDALMQFLEGGDLARVPPFVPGM